MENTGEVGFKLEETIEQTPFDEPGVQKFFGEWCKVNDGIKPKFIERKKWDKKGGMDEVLRQTWRKDKNVLSIPKDLHLWEMVDVMEAVDKDTFSDNPEQRPNKKEELVNLGHMFENAGVYIAQRLDFIDRGKGIAGDLAVQFYDYGQSLVSGKKPDTKADLNEIANLTIPDEELEEIDRWLGGDEFYATKRGQLDLVLAEHPDERAELFEGTRRDALMRYFRMAERSFIRLEKEKSEGSKLDISELKPWESPASIHKGFIYKSKGHIQRAVEKPKRELESSIFRRGMNKLQREIGFDKLPEEIKNDFLSWENGETTLREALGIDEWKRKLDEIRERGDKDEIFEAEIDAAVEIQKIVSSYPRGNVDRPTQILESQTINCVGASMLGGAFLSELSIKYLVGAQPEHSMLYLITATDEVAFFDMLYPGQNHMLREESLLGQTNDGSPLAISDLIEFAREEKGGSLNFGLKGDDYSHLSAKTQAALHSSTVYNPEIGHMILALGNLGMDLQSSGRFTEAIDLYKKAMDHDKFDFSLNIAYCLIKLKRSDEAIDTLRQAIKREPLNLRLLAGLGVAFYETGNYTDAVSTSRHAIELGLNNVDIHVDLADSLEKIGEKDEAIKAYEKAIELDPASSEVYRKLGSLFDSMGDIERAIEKYEKYLEYSSDRRMASRRIIIENRLVKLRQINNRHI